MHSAGPMLMVYGHRSPALPCHKPSHWQSARVCWIHRRMQDASSYLPMHGKVVSDHPRRCAQFIVERSRSTDIETANVSAARLLLPIGTAVNPLRLNHRQCGPATLNNPWTTELKLQSDEGISPERETPICLRCPGDTLIGGVPQATAVLKRDAPRANTGERHSSVPTET